MLGLLKISKGSVEFSGKNIVFTGKLTTMSREEAKEKALKLGARIQSSISNNTDYLICGESPGSKLSKARELNIKILSEKNWKLVIN